MLYVCPEYFGHVGWGSGVKGRLLFGVLDFYLSCFFAVFSPWPMIDELGYGSVYFVLYAYKNDGSTSPL